MTHRLTSITDYDRIFVVVAGRIVEQGTHDEFVRGDGTYSQLWAEQTTGHVPAETPFDAPAALARLPIFAGLEAGALADVAAAYAAKSWLRALRVAEGGGRLLLLRRGRALSSRRRSTAGSRRPSSSARATYSASVRYSARRPVPRWKRRSP